MKITESLKGILLSAYETSITGTRLHPMRLLAKGFPLKFPNPEDCQDNKILSVNGQQSPVAEGNTNTAQNMQRASHCLQRTCSSIFWYL